MEVTLDTIKIGQSALSLSHIQMHVLLFVYASNCCTCSV